MTDGVRRDIQAPQDFHSVYITQNQEPTRPFEPFAINYYCLLDITCILCDPSLSLLRCCAARSVVNGVVVH